MRLLGESLSLSKSFLSMGLGLERFSIPSITSTKHLAHIPMALHEFPMGLPALIIDDMRFAPEGTSINVLSEKVMRGIDLNRLAKKQYSLNL